MLKIFTRVKGIVGVEREVRKIAKRAKDPKEIFETIAEDFADYESTVFVNAGAVHGMKGWAKLKPATLKEKRLKGFSSRILVRTGRLEESLTDTKDKDFVFRVIGKNRMEIGTRLPYAEILKKGEKGRMARRNPIRIPQEKVKAWGLMFKRFVLGGKGSKKDVFKFMAGNQVDK